MSQSYSAPVSVICSSTTSLNTININLSPYTEFVPSQYILKTYTNNVLTSTSTQQVYSTITNQIVVNGLSCLNVYSFQVQLLNDTQSSLFSLKNENIPVYPVGPTITSRSSITSTTVQVIYSDYTTGGFDLSGAVCIIDAPGISYSNLTNTSVTLTNLTQNTTYNLTILFRKTINGFVISSSPSSVSSFKTNASAPVNPSSQPLTDSSSAATISYDPYTVFTPTSGTVYYNGSPLHTVSTVSTTQVTVTGLTSATTYAGCTLVLAASGASSDPSAAFTITTFASAPAIVKKSVTTTTINLTITKPTPLFTISRIDVYDSNGKFEDIYVVLVSQTEVQLRYLNSGRTYSGVYIIVSDGTYTSVKSISIDVSTDPSPAPVVDVNTLTPGANSVVINYSDYYAFPMAVSGGIFYDSTGISQGTVTVSSAIPYRQLTVTGLSPITYTNSYIKLTSNNNTSAASNLFSFRPLEIPVLSEWYVDEAFNGPEVWITYITGFTSFTPNSASKLFVTYGPNNSPVTTSFNGINKESQADTSMIFPGLTVQREYRDCYIILSNGTNFSAHSVGTYTGSTFTFYAVGGASGQL